jgi:hypothetical protein
MANQDFTPTNTYATLITAGTGNSKNVRQLWRKGALLAEQSTDFFQEMESKSQRGLIWTQSDTSKGQGALINFTTQSGFYKKPKLGDAMFEVAADFDKIRQENFQLNVDYARWAVRTNKRMEEILGMRGDIESGVNVELGKNWGRYKTEQIFGLTLLKLPVANVMHANGKTMDSLMSADTLRWDEIVTVGQAMLPMGGLPANVAGKNATGPIWSQTFVATTPALTSLKLDSAWRDVLKNGDVRGSGNTIFKGGYPSIDGHTIAPYNPIDHDGEGPMGSFLNPKAFYGGADTTTASTTFDVQGGGNATVDTSVDYFRYFAGSPYDFIDTLQALGANGYTRDVTSAKFFLIYNLTGAHAGKWGMYAYQVNDGQKLVVTGRLTKAAASGIGNPIMGGVGYSATTGLGGTSPATSAAQGVLWDDAVNSDIHTAGALIIPCNCSGVPYGDTIALGQSGILRAYGEFRAEHTVDLLNGKFVTDRYLTSVFGQTFKYDRKGRVTSVMRLRHAITYPGIKLPIRG